MVFFICGFENDVLLFSGNVAGERIFRIGLFRYKMDPSRRTLQRISGGHFIIVDDIFH